MTAIFIPHAKTSAGALAIKVDGGGNTFFALIVDNRLEIWKINNLNVPDKKYIKRFETQYFKPAYIALDIRGSDLLIALEDRAESDDYRGCLESITGVCVPFGKISTVYVPQPVAAPAPTFDARGLQSSIDTALSQIDDLKKVVAKLPTLDVVWQKVQDAIYATISGATAGKASTLRDVIWKVAGDRVYDDVVNKKLKAP